MGWRKGNLMTDTAPARSTRSAAPPRARSHRPAVRAVLALAAAGLAFALIPLGVLQIGYAIPIIGLLLAAGIPSDTGPVA